MTIIADFKTALPTNASAQTARASVVGNLLGSPISTSNATFAADGEALFKANCSNCHKPDADYTGPALKGWADREPSKEWIYKWVANPAQMIASDAYAKQLFEKNAIKNIKSHSLMFIIYPTP